MPHAVQRTLTVKMLFEDKLVGFTSYESPNQPFPLKFDLVTSATQLKEEDLQACIDLVEQTSGADYRASRIGWNTRKKREEMMDKDMIYLLVRQANTNTVDEETTSPNPPILGFISFMFTWDDPPHQDRAVLYIYEIHLSRTLRSQGLGSRLMTFVEAVARACSIEKTMLTVFVANEGAKRMYEKLGYGRDECSPVDRVMRRKVVRAEYVVMSKKVL
ncbi:hypothetical protein COCCADRAFT_82713 [Bipolaris zeicola 26-R-13]|uniref:N-alpha-acetyltransferase 40 n=1 Tax=Cochliobolus carbonum (strain 26-R-13) TaxID=930089 RepID=W6Z4G2_COCC2|nr:uncharacterized protein COCCADRAFT_82713 [Bipolaris zeicola 26-R-13]EUC38586.1 hypothetical protein COCCADRAFT_82713 [Bipolaris zeicola 26-R-13]